MAYRRQKEVLRSLYGNRCMLCERILQRKKQTFHHRIPLKNGGKNSTEMGCILCMECQMIIHAFEYGTEAYTKLDNKIANNLEKYRK